MFFLHQDHQLISLRVQVSWYKGQPKNRAIVYNEGKRPILNTVVTTFTLRSYLFFKICLLLHISFVLLLQPSKLVLNLAKGGTLLIQTLPRNANNSSVISLFWWLSIKKRCLNTVMSLLKGKMIL